MSTRRLLAPALACLATIAAGCGGGASSPTAGPHLPLTVAADPALKALLTQYAHTSGDTRPALAFTDPAQLAGRARAADRPDVIATTTATLPDELHAAGLVRTPIAFGSSVLEIATRAGVSTVQSIEDLPKPGLRLAIAGRSTALGVHTREVIARLPAGQRRAILANAVSTGDDSAAIVDALLHGRVDAALLYVRDVSAAIDAHAGKRPGLDGAPPVLNPISLPADLDPVTYVTAAIVDGTHHPAAARLFLYGLLSGPGPKAADGAGYGGRPPT